MRRRKAARFSRREFEAMYIANIEAAFQNIADGASTVAAKLLAGWSGLSPADALGIIEETMPESVAGRLIGEIQ